ncbi:predicted protein [Histoplasma capsulatum G186AR]|uniref:Uncharacterized protein n=1 Tax=Ajellomyces capsulatus (strain G186AR / H82 / ATCC MYA-2454 / RMSCC 2432) TaxID=447093 RepID=C0NPD4_AJECG|nr:uncharacterized protein HCBG_05014 [Histoplasma capsulatum G186AR]EEH06794.1 predicted protein [Histoplasma capsulatum G186AR]
MGTETEAGGREEEEEKKRTRRKEEVGLLAKAATQTIPGGYLCAGTAPPAQRLLAQWGKARAPVHGWLRCLAAVFSGHQAGVSLAPCHTKTQPKPRVQVPKGTWAGAWSQDG